MNPIIAKAAPRVNKPMMMSRGKITSAQLPSSTTGTKIQEIAESVGFVLGALLGGAIGGSADRSGGGATAGAIVGAESGRLGQGATTLVDGVQLVYREGDRVLQSAQVGLPCEFAPGPALVTVTKAQETRVQSNHTCVKGQEQIAGRVSNLQGLGTIEAADQDGLDDLERQRALIRKQQEVQSAKTGLARETASNS